MAFEINSLISEIQADENFASDIVIGVCAACCDQDYLNEDNVCCECSYTHSSELDAMKESEDSFNHIEDAREWLLECFEDEYDQETIEELDDAGIVNAINRYYHDGMEAFNESCE